MRGLIDAPQRHGLASRARSRPSRISSSPNTNSRSSSWVTPSSEAASRGYAPDPSASVHSRAPSGGISFGSKMSWVKPRTRLLMRCVASWVSWLEKPRPGTPPRSRPCSRGSRDSSWSARPRAGGPTDGRGSRAAPPALAREWRRATAHPAAEARSARQAGRPSRRGPRPCWGRGCRATSPRPRGDGRSAASTPCRGRPRPRAGSPRARSARGSGPPAGLAAPRVAPVRTSVVPALTYLRRTSTLPATLTVYVT